MRCPVNYLKVPLGVSSILDILISDGLSDKGKNAG